MPNLPKLQNLYLDKYLPTGQADLPALLSLADEYDEWFVNKFLPFLEGQLTITKGHWQLTDASGQATITAGRFLSEGAASIIVNGVNKWLTEGEDPRIVQFYRNGLKLWQINMEALGLPYPRKPKLDKLDKALIKLYLSTFNSTWQNHLNKHVRTINRFVNTGQEQGWTKERFLANCLTPKGHIVAFRVGDTHGHRQSWHDTIRRFGVARPRIMAQVCQAERMGRG